MQKPIERIVRKRAKELVAALQEDFPNYEIEQVVADVELKMPKMAKASLKVTMRIKEE